MTRQDFHRVAIVDRGDAAMRFVRAAREWSAERDDRLRTIALFTDPERTAMFVREADESYGLGAPTFVDEGGRTKSSYLNYDLLAKALTETHADAVWMGWSFVADYADFADLCHNLGLVVIGPDGDTLRRAGNRVSAKRLAMLANVPQAPWSGGPVDSLATAHEHGEHIGYPLVVKAAVARGDGGSVFVHDPSELEAAINTVKSEAQQVFANPAFFMERVPAGARRFEVQTACDHHGHVWTMGIRECSVRQGRRRLFEESPPPLLSLTHQSAIEVAARTVMEAVGFQNVGSVRFLFDPANQRFSFDEVVPRLQREHAVSEVRAGIDLVKLQLAIARGEVLSQAPTPNSGHGIQVAVYADGLPDSAAASSSKIQRLSFAVGHGVRVDTGLREGDAVQPDFEPLIARVAVWGKDRPEALGRLNRALLESDIVLQSSVSNKGLLLGLLQRQEVKSARLDSALLDRMLADGHGVLRENAEVAFIQAVINSYNTESAVERAQFLTTAARGRPELREYQDKQVELTYRGQPYRATVNRAGRDLYRVDIDGQRIEAVVERYAPYEGRLTIAGRQYRVRFHDHGLTHIVEVNGIPHRFTRERGSIVRAPAPAVVVSILVREGDEVTIGDPMVVLEAMKSEMTVNAQFTGRIRSVEVLENVQVATGAPLIRIGPTEAPEYEDTARLSFVGQAGPLTSAWARCAHNLAELKCLTLGYDAFTSEVHATTPDRRALCEGVPADHPEMVRREAEVLSIFVDVCSLFRRRPDEEGDDEELGGRVPEEYLHTYLKDLNWRNEQLPAAFISRLRRALSHYGVESLERTEELEESLYRIYKAHHHVDEQVVPVLRILQHRLDSLTEVEGQPDEAFRQTLERLILETYGRFQSINDVARELLFRLFEQPVQRVTTRQAYADVERTLSRFADAPEHERGDLMTALVECPYPLKTFFARRRLSANRFERKIMLEALTRRYYRLRPLTNVKVSEMGEHDVCSAEYEHESQRLRLLSAQVSDGEWSGLVDGLRGWLNDSPRDVEVMLDFYVWRDEESDDVEVLLADAKQRLAPLVGVCPIHRMVVALSTRGVGLGIGRVQHFTFRVGAEGLVEDRQWRAMHPMMGKRLRLWRLSNFELDRLPSVEDVYLFHATAHSNPKDQRLFALAEVRDLTPRRDAAGHVIGLPTFERMFSEGLAGIRRYQAQRSERERLHWNRLQLFVWPPVDLPPDDLNALIHRLAPATAGLGIERILVQGRFRNPTTGEYEEKLLDISNPSASGLSIRFRPLPDYPMEPLTPYAQNVVRLRQRGLVYPYELISMLTPPREDAHTDLPSGEFVEHDLNDEGRLVPVDRPPGNNSANIVVGLVTNYTEKYPEGMTRVILLGDPSRGMGSLAEPECARINAGLDLAAERGIPLEWMAVSAGAKISMDSGTENMDWIAAVLRKLIEFTQAGGEVNIVVCGINVGAQPYWNAEATMLMHTRGILIMVGDSAMVLTGKRSLDYSGGVSADDNEGIGGYEHIMGPNGQAQYRAEDYTEAFKILLRYYDHSYVLPGEQYPRRGTTGDSMDRDVCRDAHPRMSGSSFQTIGDIFSPYKNPDRKKPFQIRALMQACVDRDREPLERWTAQRDAEASVIWDAHIGGFPVCLLGIESHPLVRHGYVSVEGPGQWTAGTLFPQSSKKVARALNASRKNRPFVVLANLSGFDGSPESMRNWQLEYGAEIGRAVVNFVGPIVFLVVSRYHGGAFVVFSAKLNEQMEVAAVEGAYASVIGGAPAAAVVFAREVNKRTMKDERVVAATHALATADGASKAGLREQLNRAQKVVYSEKLKEVGDEFDGIHSIHRAQRVGSVHRIIQPAEIRPYLIDAIERGIKRVHGPT